MCATLMIFVYSINKFWNLFIERHIKFNKEAVKLTAAAAVAAVCVISANFTVSSIAYHNSLELAFIEAELAKHNDYEFNEIIQVVPFLKKWKIPELCYKVPCKGEFAWKMTSIVDGAVSQLRFARELVCGGDEVCSERRLKITRVITPPDSVKENTAVIDMRPLYKMYKHRADLMK
jgi:hypothetical protein